MLPPPTVSFMKRTYSDPVRFEGSSLETLLLEDLDLTFEVLVDGVGSILIENTTR